MGRSEHDNQSFLGALIGDGRSLLTLTGLILILAGGFAIFQSATGHFLPHDEQYLGMTAGDLCKLSQCRIVHFMFHDRVSFGGAIIAVGTLYLWLAEFPMRAGEAWAWWLFVISGAIGFGSFLAYLGYGYLDSWHGTATLILLPVYIAGVWLTRKLVRDASGLHSLFQPGVRVTWRSAAGIGRACLLLTAIGLMIGGLTIMVIGSTSVFVPQDIGFIGMSPAELRAVNPHLVPLIAHDRAGFGGGLACTGMIVLFCVWCGKPSRSLWQAVVIAGSIGFATAIGIHPVIGYVDATHLAPAVVLAVIFMIGVVLSGPSMYGGDQPRVEIVTSTDKAVG